MSGRHSRPRAGDIHGHAHGHAHGHGGGDVRIGGLPRAVVLGLLAAVALVCVVGVVVWWPDGERSDKLRGSVQFAAPGVAFVSGEITDTPDRTHLVVDPQGRDGAVTVEVPPAVGRSGLGPGDHVELLRTPGAEGQPTAYSFFGVERDRPLLILALLFAVVVLAVARWRGLMALVGLGFAGVVVWFFVLPALLTGESAVPVALVGSALIMYVVLYTTHGLSMRTSAALLGTLAGVAVTMLVAWWAVGATHLAGIGDEASGLLSTEVPHLRLSGLLLAAMLVAGLGVLNDVTITQASAVWELRAAAPELTRRQLMASGMRIGRDHIASTIYTIVFAYAGTALLVLLVIQLYDRPLVDLLGTEELATEIVRSLAGSIGLVLAVPITTLVAALTVGGRARPASGDLLGDAAP